MRALLRLLYAGIASAAIVIGLALLTYGLLRMTLHDLILGAAWIGAAVLTLGAAIGVWSVVLGRRNSRGEID